jgi:excisionase family DNA binding protein
MAPQTPARGAPAPEQDWLTLGQAARFLGVAQSTIRKWSDQGRLPAFYTPGGHRRFQRAHLEAFVDRSRPGGRRGGPLVLVVEADQRLREQLRVNLELGGYLVREAAAGPEALATINDQSPDLVLLDLVLPGLDGWELLRQLHGLHGSIPVIVFSGAPDRQSGPTGSGLPAAVRGEPFDPEELLARAKRLVPA